MLTASAHVMAEN